MSKKIVYYKLSFSDEDMSHHTSIKSGTCFSTFASARKALLTCFDQFIKRKNEYCTDYIYEFVSSHHHLLSNIEESFQIVFKHDDFYYVYYMRIGKCYLFLND